MKKQLHNLVDRHSESLQGNTATDEKLGHIVFKYACARIQDNEGLGSIMQSLLTPGDDNPLLPVISEAIMNDDAETVGRLLIDAVTAAAWAIAEQDSQIHLTTQPLANNSSKKH